MAALLRHPRDHVRTCVGCGVHCEHIYIGTQILDTEPGLIVEGQHMTCSSCKSTRFVDYMVRPQLTSDDVLRVTERRADWFRVRGAA